MIPVAPSRLSKWALFCKKQPYVLFSNLVDERKLLGTFWFCLVYFIYLYNIFTVSWRFCFYDWFTDPIFWLIPDQITDAILYIDFFFRFFRPYKDRQTTKIITDKKSTARHYVITKVYVDIVARFPLDWMSFIWGYSSIFRLNRFVLVYNSYTEMKRFESTWVKIKSKQRTLILFLYMSFLSSHLMTCGWYLVARSEDPKPIKWVNSNILFDEGTSWWYRYGTGFYWSLVVMAGFGGALPVTDLECAYQILVTFVGMALFVTAIGTVGILVNTLDITAVEFRDRLDSINDYMAYRNMSQDLRTRISSYYSYIWKTRRGLDETKLFNDLPKYLRAEVAMYLNRGIIEKVEIFKDTSPNFVSEVVMNLKPRIALPGSYIIRIGEPGSEMYFINKGRVKVKLGNGICVAQLGEGDFFGEMALLTDGIRTANIIAQTYCDLFVLDKADFDEILAAYPEDSAHMVNIGRRRSQANQSKRLKRSGTSISMNLSESSSSHDASSAALEKPQEESSLE